MIKAQYLSAIHPTIHQMTDVRGVNLVDSGVNTLARYLVPNFEEKVTPIELPAGSLGNSTEHKIPTYAEYNLGVPHATKPGTVLSVPSLSGLKFDGTFNENFRLEILVNGNVLARYNSPYRFILEQSNIIEFHVPHVFGQIELLIEGFRGTCTMFDHSDLDQGTEWHLFNQPAGGSKFKFCTTDLMVADKQPVESVVCKFNCLFDSEPFMVRFDEAALDAMYTKFTGKQNRPKNFAICTLKNKELVNLQFNPRLELVSVFVNDVPVSKSTVHYHCNDIFMYAGCMVALRYLS